MNRRLFYSVAVMVMVLSVSIGCGLVTGVLQMPQTGVIKIVNDHVRASDHFPGGKNLPDAREYGICIIVYQPIDPDGLIKPTFDMILAKDQEETTYSLPAGTYTVQEWQFDSEVNTDPGYSPAFRTLVRPPEIIVLNANQVINFGDRRSLSFPGEFEEGTLLNPNCRGGMTKTTIEPLTPTPGVVQEEEFFAVRNISSVTNGATAATTFTIHEPWHVSFIITYHWNNAEGTTDPGTVSLVDAEGNEYGPWQAEGQPGQGNVTNAVWVVRPDITLPAGTYTIIDSDPSTWSQNEETGGAGMAWGSGTRADNP